MKTNIGVFFGGRSTEHEISVISASQAMHAIDREKYDVTPIYITKQGKWYTGEALFDVANYRNIPELLKSVRKYTCNPCMATTGCIRPCERCLAAQMSLQRLML